jgi:hypothetical protein
VPPSCLAQEGQALIDFKEPLSVSSRRAALCLATFPYIKRLGGNNSVYSLLGGNLQPTKVRADPMSAIEQVFDNVLDATTVSALEEPMRDLKVYARNDSTVLSDLWRIVSVARKRVATLRLLSDLGDDEGIPQNPREKVVNWFGNLAEILNQKFLRTAATGILTELWNELGQYQYTLNNSTATLRHIYRAGVGMYLGRIYLQGELGAAIWWLLHAHADDLLGRHAEKGGAAKDMLRLIFGVDKGAFDYMERCAEENLSNNQTHTLFAEHVVMQLSLRHEYSSLFSYPTSLVEFPIGRAYAAAMLSRVKEKPEGEPLEELARYLMLLLAGWVPTKNVYHARTRMDSDLIARYMREPEAISSAHSRAILAECKNIDNTLSVSDTGYFLYRMYLHQVNVGILFARKNVSGRSSSDEVAQDRNAKHLLNLAFQRDGTAVVVIDLEDIRELVDGTKTFWSLIDGRIVERRFGKASANDASP